MYPPSKDFGPFSAGRTSLLPRAASRVSPQARFPRLGAVHPSDGLEESIYYALLLYSSKRSGPSGGT